jgi:MFS family permease
MSETDRRGQSTGLLEYKQSLPLKPHEMRGDDLRRTMRLVTMGWFWGAMWMGATSGAALTNYAKALGASNFQFGVLAALPFMAAFLSLPGTLLIEATGRRKLIFLIGLYIHRAMWIPLAIVPWWLYRHYGSPLAMASFLSMLFVMYGAGAAGGPGWIGWMSDIVPPRIRGTYFSYRRQWGLASAIVAALISGMFLDETARSGNRDVVLHACAIVFIVACVFGLADIFTFHFVRDVPTTPKRGTALLAAWGEPLHNRNYLRFAGFVAVLVFAVGFMGQFTTLFIMQQLGQVKRLNLLTQIMLLICPWVAALLVSGIWGRAADRMGKRPLLIVAGLGLVPVAVGWCFVTPERIWLGYVLSFLGGALWAGVDIVNFNIVLEFSGSAGKGGSRGGTAYMGVNSVIINIAGMASGFASGWIAQWLKDFHWSVAAIGDFSYFQVLFVLSAVLRLLAVVAFLPFLHEPEARPMVDALRYMGTNIYNMRYMWSNIYNNLFNAIMQPLRSLGRQDDE